MEERFGVQGTPHNGVFFTEATIPGAASLGRVSVEISRQNSHLNAVKDKMATEAQVKGATAIHGFRYGQRSHKWWQMAFTFKWDSESWYGEGEACKPQ